MKTLLSLASSLALAALLPARAQTTPAAAPRTPTPVRAKAAEPGPETYQSPRVVQSSKELGRKMMEKSKPADAVRMRVQPLK